MPGQPVVTANDVDNPAQAAAEPPPGSSAELALEISRLVARAMRGETIDVASSGEALAARFPDAGMTGEMIAQAIERAAGMVDMIRDGVELEAAPKNTEASDPNSTDAALAAALDAELSDLVGDQTEDAPGPPDDEPAEPVTEPDETADAGDRTAPRTRGLMGRVAALGRVFSRG